LNLTTVDFSQVDANVSQILNSATGTFHDDVQKRSEPFIDVVKRARSKSVGTVSDAGVESVQGDQAQVLLAVQVKTSVAGGLGQEPRGWAHADRRAEGRRRGQGCERPLRPLSAGA
jgi:Mce-associated membrane protein